MYKMFNILCLLVMLNSLLVETVRPLYPLILCNWASVMLVSTLAYDICSNVVCNNNFL